MMSYTVELVKEFIIFIPK